METFENLSEDKKNTILNAGFYCFAKNGYQKTSVLDIAKKAGVSKSSIFYYFENKKNLYLYLYDCAVNIIMDSILKNLRYESNDFFERIYEIKTLKLQVLMKHKDLYNFIASSVKEEDASIVKIVQEKNKPYMKKAYKDVFKGVKWTKFKPNLKITMVMNIVAWVTEGYSKNNIDKKSLDELMQEGYEYVELLRTAFYKEEYL